jgi:hypothetical protein
MGTVQKVYLLYQVEREERAMEERRDRARADD